MSESIVSFTRGIKSAINSRNKTDGELLFSTDTEEIFLQNGENTIPFSDLILLSSEEERTEILAPISKLYLVKTTGNLWYWDAENGWWMLLNSGEVQTRNLIVNTMPVSVGYNVDVEIADNNNWTAHTTIISMNEDMYISPRSYLRTAIGQIPDSNSKCILGIYRYDYQERKLYKVCNTDVINIESTGLVGGYITTAIDKLLLTTNTYCFVLFHNGNGIRTVGATGNTMNSLPYISGKIANLGDLSQNNLPESMEFQSEVVNRIYGSMLSNVPPEKMFI